MASRPNWIMSPTAMVTMASPNCEVPRRTNALMTKRPSSSENSAPHTAPISSASHTDGLPRPTQ